MPKPLLNGIMSFVKLRKRRQTISVEYPKSLFRVEVVLSPLLLQLCIFALDTMCACIEHLPVNAFGKRKQVNTHKQIDRKPHSLHSHTHRHTFQTERDVLKQNNDFQCELGFFFWMRIFIRNIMIWKRKFFFRPRRFKLMANNVWKTKHTVLSFFVNSLTFHTMAISAWLVSLR